MWFNVLKKEARAEPVAKLWQLRPLRRDRFGKAPRFPVGLWLNPAPSQEARKFLALSY